MSNTEALGFTEATTRHLLHDVEALIDHAEAVASVVFRLRFPKSTLQSVNVAGLRYALEENEISATYWAGGQDNQFEYPLEYLWLTREQIEDAEQERAERLAREVAERKATDDAEATERRRQEFLRLKAEFDPEPEPGE